MLKSSVHKAPQPALEWLDPNSQYRLVLLLNNKTNAQIYLNHMENLVRL